MYDIGERDHIEIQRRRNDFESLSRWLGERGLFFSANHVFSSLTGRRALQDFELFETAFPAVETRNGHMLPYANANAAALADFAGRAEVGGSDAHAMSSVGCAWTVVPNARSKQEYLAGLRHGRGRVRGASGNWWKLTRDVLTHRRRHGSRESGCTPRFCRWAWPSRWSPWAITQKRAFSHVFGWRATCVKEYREERHVRPQPVVEAAI